MCAHDVFQGKKVPIGDLYEDLKKGTPLLSLLEVLSGFHLVSHRSLSSSASFNRKPLRHRILCNKLCVKQLGMILCRNRRKAECACTT